MSWGLIKLNKEKEIDFRMSEEVNETNVWIYNNENVNEYVWILFWNRSGINLSK